MVYFRKCMITEIIGKINEMIITAEQTRLEKEKEESTENEFDDSNDNDKNSRTMIVDATWVPFQTLGNTAQFIERAMLEDYSVSLPKN